MVLPYIQNSILANPNTICMLKVWVPSINSVCCYFMVFCPFEDASFREEIVIGARAFWARAQGRAVVGHVLFVHCLILGLCSFVSEIIILIPVSTRLW